jgi:hypothetical protein
MKNDFKFNDDGKKSKPEQFDSRSNADSLPEQSNWMTLGCVIELIISG